MGCSFSGLNAMYDAANATGELWINENRFRIVRQLGEGGPASVFLVRETSLPAADRSRDEDGASSAFVAKKLQNPSHVSEDGTYAMKKVVIGSEQQLEAVREEIRVSSLFSHSNLLPLLDHAIIKAKGHKEKVVSKAVLPPTRTAKLGDTGGKDVGLNISISTDGHIPGMPKDTHDGSQNYEAYLLFPVHMDGTLLDNSKIMQSKKEFFPTLTVLQIFRQICAGLKHMHNFEPPYAHNDVKPGNVLITQKKGQPHIAILMDFGSATPARKEIHSEAEALKLKEWASENCSAPFRAPELWDCPSHAYIDERTDIWSLGCTLYAIMYGASPFECELDESEDSLKLALMNAQVKWPTGPNTPYPDFLHQFVVWMLQPQPAIRPGIEDILIHVDKLIEKHSS